MREAYEHRAGSIKNVTGGELFSAGLQEVAPLYGLSHRGDTLKDREDRAYRDIHVDVRGT